MRRREVDRMREGGLGTHTVNEKLNYIKRYG